jgi:hypothetical protein
MHTTTKIRAHKAGSPGILVALVALALLSGCAGKSSWILTTPPPGKPAAKRLVTIQDGQFLDGEGFGMVNTPKDVAIYRIASRPHIWYVYSADGTPKAVITERSDVEFDAHRRPVSAEAATFGGVDSVRERVTLPWLGGTTEIVRDTFASATHAYIVERTRTEDWVRDAWRFLDHETYGDEEVPAEGAEGAEGSAPTQTPLKERECAGGDSFETAKVLSDHYLTGYEAELTVCKGRKSFFVDSIRRRKTVTVTAASRKPVEISIFDQEQKPVARGKRKGRSMGAKTRFKIHTQYYFVIDSANDQLVKITLKK